MKLSCVRLNFSRNLTLNFIKSQKGKESHKKCFECFNKKILNKNSFLSKYTTNLCLAMKK